MNDPLWRIHLYDTKPRLRVLEGWLAGLGLALTYRDGIAHPSSMRDWLTGLACLEFEIPRTRFRRLAKFLPISPGSLDVAVLTQPVPTIILRGSKSRLSEIPSPQQQAATKFA